LSRDVSNHRLGAYIYGFLSGAGLTMLVWGVASFSWLPTRSTTAFATLIFSGVFLLAFGGSREAYLRGSLSTAQNASASAEREKPLGETGTKELVLYEQETQDKV